MGLKCTIQANGPCLLLARAALASEVDESFIKDTQELIVLLKQDWADNAKETRSD